MIRFLTLAVPCLILLTGGCRQSPEITSLPASPFNQHEPPGMPFYMPKPLLVVSKNVRHIDEAKVGLTHPAPIPHAFDDQASYADIKANVTSPGQPGEASQQAADAGGTARADGEPFDEKAMGLPDGWRGAMTPAGRVQEGHGLRPDSFYTYQIIFVPDLSQKYGLNIKGNPGEVRAAMNLVNGWMYTGMGPYYLKDSSKAQNIMAVGVASLFAGRGAADVLDSVTGLAAGAAGVPKPERAKIDSDVFVERVAGLAKILQSQTLTPREMVNYAEVSIYEPQLCDGKSEWVLICSHIFDRQYFSPDMDKSTSTMIQGLLEKMVPKQGTSVEGKKPKGDGSPTTGDPPMDPRAPAAPTDTTSSSGQLPPPRLQIPR